MAYCGTSTFGFWVRVFHAVCNTARGAVPGRQFFVIPSMWPQAKTRNLWARNIDLRSIARK